MPKYGNNNWGNTYDNFDLGVRFSTFLCNRKATLSFAQKSPELCVRFSHFNRKLTRVERQKIKDFLLSWV